MHDIIKQALAPVTPLYNVPFADLKRAQDNAAQVRMECADKTPPGLRQPWFWVQPRTIGDILNRLTDALEYAVPERERENMCSVAFGTIARMASLLAQAERNLREDNRVALADAIEEAIK